MAALPINASAIIRLLTVIVAHSCQSASLRVKNKSHGHLIHSNRLPLVGRCLVSPSFNVHECCALEHPWGFALGDKRVYNFSIRIDAKLYDYLTDVSIPFSFWRIPQRSRREQVALDLSRFSSWRDDSNVGG